MEIPGWRECRISVAAFQRGIANLLRFIETAFEYLSFCVLGQ